jgi:5-formyltetrahydrofolate cyclo-ligase
MLALRDNMPSDQLDIVSSRIASRLFEVREFSNARTISLYLHMGSEVRTSTILAWCLGHQKRVIVPVIDRANRRLIFSELKAPQSELEPGTFGILEPRPESLRLVSLEEADVALVPGVVWDLHGYRIGYGGGYYDRTVNSLHGNLLTIGLAYEFQILRELPRTRYDTPVHKVVTERRTLTTRPVASAALPRNQLPP